MEQQENYEQEIDLKDLMFSVLRKWRPILVTAVIFAVLLGGVKAAKGLRQLQDAEYVKQNKETYEIALEQYDNSKERLEKEIENLQENIKNQQTYKEESVLMNINPYDEYAATATLYVDTDYQIMPGMAYQNINTASSVLKAYMAIAQNGEMYNFIQERMDEKLEHRYLKELITIEPDYNNNMLSITVVSDSEKRTKELMDSILEAAEASKGAIRQSIGSHELHVVEESQTARVDLNLVTIQQDCSNKIKDLDTALTAKTKELKELQEPKETLLSKMSVVKGAVKYAVLGGVLGAFMLVFFICVGFLMSDKLVNEKEIKRRYGVLVLGVLKKQEKAKPFAFVDRWISRLDSSSDRELDDAKAYEIIAANVSNYIDGVREVVLVGTVESEKLDEIRTKLSALLPEIALTSGGHVGKDASAIKKAAQCDAVILVEKRNDSCFGNISQELELVKSLDKKVLGCVVL